MVSFGGVPAWLRLFHRHSDLFLTAFVVSVIIRGFTTLISLSFFATGRVMDRGVRRLRQNLGHLLEIMIPGGLDRHGDGWKLSGRIRLIHAQIRKLLAESGEWDAVPSRSQGAETMESPPPIIERVCSMVEYTLQRPDAEGVVRRALHAPGLGLMRGTLTIDDGLPPEIAHGLFAQPRSLEAWVRYSRGYFFDPKTPDTFGMAVKLTGVPGEGCSPETPGEQDLITVNIPYSWVGNREDVIRFFTILEGNRKSELERKGEKIFE